MVTLPDGVWSPWVAGWVVVPRLPSAARSSRLPPGPPRRGTTTHPARHHLTLVGPRPGDRPRCRSAQGSPTSVARATGPPSDPSATTQFRASRRRRARPQPRQTRSRRRRTTVLAPKEDVVPLHLRRCDGRRGIRLPHHLGGATGPGKLPRETRPLPRRGGPREPGQGCGDGRAVGVGSDAKGRQSGAPKTHARQSRVTATQPRAPSPPPPRTRPRGPENRPRLYLGGPGLYLGGWQVRRTSPAGCGCARWRCAARSWGSRCPARPPA